VTEETAGRLDDQLCFALYAATNAITRSYRPLLDGIGLTYPQFLVLVILWEHRSRSVGQLAETLHLASHALSPIVARLEDGGLVRRVRDTADGRVVRVELTERGSQLEPVAAAIQQEVRGRTLLDDADLARLRASLAELTGNMGVS
jgi:DNA-binding MarR family transcriptional regulator